MVSACGRFGAAQQRPLLGGYVGLSEVVQSDEAIAVDQDLGNFLVVDEEVALQSVAVLASIGQFGDLGGAADAGLIPAA
jgi:hypothetical protein